CSWSSPPPCRLLPRPGKHPSRGGDGSYSAFWHFGATNGFPPRKAGRTQTTTLKVRHRVGGLNLRSVHRLLAVVFTLLWAGCFGASGIQKTGVPGSEITMESFRTMVIDPSRGGWEPSTAVAPDGT